MMLDSIGFRKRKGWVPVNMSKDVWSRREWNCFVLEVESFGVC